MNFKPGFRISKIDILVLVVGALSAGYCYSRSLVISLIIIFVIGHFFIFCNITRMSRVPELIWSGTFLLLAGFSASTGQPSWFVTFLLSTFTTFTLVVFEARKPSYHGVFWQTLNPNLPSWFKKIIQKQSHNNTFNADPRERAIVRNRLNSLQRSKLVAKLVAKGVIDRMLYILSIAILILASGLLITSGLDLVLDLEVFQLETWQTFGGGGLLFLSLLLAFLNLLIAGHPLYEYWIVVLVTSVIDLVK